MITEDYVSFETAKLLKEKGFDWLESPFYSEQDRDEWRRNSWYSIPNPCYDENIPFDSPTLYVTAPHISIQRAMKWLRKVHNFNVNIELTIHGYFCSLSHIVRDSLGHIIDIEDSELWETPYYDSYEEACEMAIKYCLEKLI